MTVWKCYIQVGDAHSQYVSILVSAGVVVDVDGDSYVKGAGGHMTPYDGTWHPNRSDAWAAVGDEIDGIAETLRKQAEACRTRAAEEALA